MRIGDILQARRSVAWEPLALAIDDHVSTGMRLVSYLVSRGELDFDDGSRALGEQRGVSPALRRHLENRDTALATKLPVTLARELCALPLGTLRTGMLVVLVRDPSETARVRLTKAAGIDVALAIAPGLYVERLVRRAYPQGMSAEIDVPLDLDEPPAPERDFDLDIEVEAPPPPPPVVARTKSRPIAVEINVKPQAAASKDPLEATIAACRDIDELGWLLDVVMAFVAKRWRAALLFEVRERRAVGVRGHGQGIKPNAIKTFVIDLDEPCLVRTARDERRVVDGLPAQPGDDDRSIAAALLSGTPVAAPITRGDAVAYVLVVGDPSGRPADDTAIDLGLLAEAMGDAVARL